MAYTFVAGDTGSAIKITCKDAESSAAINLTGYTVQLSYREKSPAVTAATTVTITNITATSGIAQYTWGTGELTAGDYQGEVKLTDGSGKITRSLTPLLWSVRATL